MSESASTFFHYRGRVDFAQLRGMPALQPPVASDGTLRRLEGPGIELSWDAATTDVAVRGDVLALAAGRARDADVALPPGEAERWLIRYAQHGERAPQAVGGGFAVVIIDFRNPQVLLFVDRFSIETLCYFATPGAIAFSDAACAVPGVRPEVDAQAIYDYLFFHVIPAPQTVFAGVRRLEPAHVVVASPERAESRTYWRPAFRESSRDDLAQCRREFIELVERSVEEEADEPATACFLSGGTDSSTVAGMLARSRGEPTHAYSIGFDAQGYDEMAYANVAARHFGLVHHAYYVTPEDLVSAIPKIAASFDQPFGNSSVVPAYCCALRAREDGFTRMLAGDGGDELFAGNTRYAMQTLLGFYQCVPKAIRAALEPAATNWKLFRRAPGLRQLGGYVRHARIPLPDRFESFNLLRQLDENALLDPGFKARVDPTHPLAQQCATWQAIDAGSTLNRMLAYDWKYTLADNDLPKVRGATRLAGVTVGYPFLGRALTEFSLGLPPEWKLKRLKLRWFFKDALRDFLPAEILRKKKHGFGLPFGPWTLRHTGLRAMVEDSLAGIARRGIVRPEFARELIAKRLPEAPGYYGEMAWILMMLEQWLRAHEAR